MFLLLNVILMIHMTLNQQGFLCPLGPGYAERSLTRMILVILMTLVKNDLHKP
jgi:hypothetical protein